MTRVADDANVRSVMLIVRVLLGAVMAALRPRASLVLENLALRQQLAVLRRSTPRPHLRPLDRAFSWEVLSPVWSRWIDVLAIVKPATGIGWHRRGTAHPHAAWAAQQIVEALGPEVHAVRLI